MLNKLFAAALILGVMAQISFAGTAQLRPNSIDRVWFTSGGKGMTLEFKSVRVTGNGTITWYADNIYGYASVNIFGMQASAGNSTTINCIPIFQSGEAVNSGAAVLTAGTAVTAIKSGFYKFTYSNNNATPTRVTMNFLVK